MKLHATPKSFSADDRGAILPFVALAAPLFILFLALVVDLDLGRLTGNKLQISADAAALAGAAVLPLKPDVDAEAILYSTKNYDTDNANTAPVLNAADIFIGNWDQPTRVFTINGTPLNAVRVTTRQDATNNNSLSSVFAGIAGINSFDIQRTAIAVASGEAGGECIGGGILSNQDVEFGSNNTLDDFCVYGHDYVKTGSDNYINEGTVLVMDDENDYLPNQGSDTNNYHDYDEQVASNTDGDWGVSLPDQIDGFYDTMSMLGVLPADASAQFPNVDPHNFTTQSGDVDSDTFTFDPTTLYYIDGDVYLRGDHSNVFVVSSGKIHVQDNANVQHSVLVANLEIYLSSDGHIGDPAVCAGTDPADFDVYMFSMKNIEFQSSMTIYATQMAAKEEFKMGSNDVAAYGLYAESNGRATIGSSNTFGGCADGLSSSFGTLPDPFFGTLKMSLRD